MLKNYLKTAWRNLARNKIFSMINILGLALGMTCCLFIFTWVKDEEAVDQFHAGKDRLYTLYQTSTFNGKTEGNYHSPVQTVKGNFVPSFLLEDVTQQIPEVKYMAYYATGYELPWGHAETIQVGDRIMKFEGSRAGADFFKMFSYPLLAGTAETALQTGEDIAISRKMAEIFFGSPQKALGKVMRYENKKDLKVTAVFENLPSNSSLKFDFLLSWAAQKSYAEWASNNFQSFLELSKNANVKSVEARVNSLLLSRLDKQPGVNTSFGLQRYSDRYLYGQFVNGKPVSGRIEYVRIFSGVAIFILLIACINFMNLSTARSVKRAKEVGLRKVVGSTRVALILQFFGEALLFSFLAMLLSLVLLIVLLPAFSYFTQKQMGFPFTSPSTWIFLVGTVLVTGLISGSYPALYLSSLQPVRILKGLVRFSSVSVFFRKSLTVFQFVLSTFLLIATIVIIRQTRYVQTTDLGYNRKNLLYIRIEGELSNQSKYLLFKQEASALPGVVGVDRSSETPQSMNFIAAPDAINWQGKGLHDAVGFNPASVGFDFVKLMDLKIVKGRDFSRRYATDSSDAFLVNEEAVRQMGMRDPIGKWVSAWAKKGHIIGVLKDYHAHSLRDPILPVMLDVKEYEYFGVIIVRTKPGQTSQAIAGLEKIYKQINPRFAFSCQFVDQEYKNLYHNELIISKLSVLFASLAILISCLGLLGLVIFASEQRVKEIGIRKVLGASVSQIIALFSRDFLRLVGIAFLIAGPLAWFVMHSWLLDFSYRISLSWWIFLLAGLLSLIVALFTVSIQSLKAALANPAKSLRSE
jgi:ABC-type antimicrobial peptide transport system permease subunit